MSKKFLTGIDLQNQPIKNAAPASAGTDVPNWQQVQALAYGLAWKPSVRAASTGPVTIASPGASVDGVTLVSGVDRLLVKNNADGTQNGIYLFNGASNPLTRTQDASQGTFVDNSTVYVNEGTINADTGWTCTNNGTITVGTTSIAFAQIGGGTAYSNGYGVKLDGTVFSIDKSVVSRGYAANIGDGTSTTLTVQHNLGTLDVIVQMFSTATGEVIDTDVGNGRTVNSVPLTFASAPANGAYRVVVLGIGG